MKVVDANVLLYAVNSDAPHHASSLEWLEGALGGGDSVGFSWTALLAFVRLSTKAELFPSPLSPTDAMTQVEDWIASPDARILHPGVRHPDILSRLLSDVGAGGNLVNDAHLAALGIENRATIVSYDNDFARFPPARWSTPDSLLAGLLPRPER